MVSIPRLRVFVNKSNSLLGDTRESTDNSFASGTIIKDEKYSLESIHQMNSVTFSYSLIQPYTFSYSLIQPYTFSYSLIQHGRDSNICSNTEGSLCYAVLYMPVLKLNSVSLKKIDIISLSKNIKN